MREFGRSTNRFRENRDDARENELIFDQNKGDILIKKDSPENDISIYDEFVKRSIEMEIIGNKPVIYGIAIDMDESDPYESVSYVADCDMFIPLNHSIDSTWTEELLYLIFGFRPFVFKDGKEICRLNPNDYTKDIDGNPIDETMGDIMIMMRKTYYKYVVSKNILYFYVSNYKPDNSYITAFNDDRMYISYYDCCNYNGELASLNNKTPITDTIDNMRSLLKQDYSLLDYKLYFYLVGLTWLLNKRLDNPNLFRFGNIVNNYLGIDGIYCNNGDLYNENKDIIYNEVFKYDYISKVMPHDKCLLYPTEYGASSNNYFCSLIHISNNITGFNEIKAHNNLLELYVDDSLQPVCNCRIVYNKKKEEEEVDYGN